MRTTRALSLRLRWLAIGLVLAGVGVFARDRALLPWSDPAPAVGEEARTLGSLYGLEIGVGSPEAFQSTLGKPLPEGISVTQADARQASLALGPLREALEAYPPDLVRFFVRGVFLAGEVKLEGTYPVGGSYGDGAIYLAVGFLSIRADAREIALGFHHEFSSLLYLYAGNDASPKDDWDAQNPGGFQYAQTPQEEFGAATAAVDRAKLESAYSEGFVHPYGRSSKENDINTYAELLMGDPEKLVTLAKRWPRIDGKARILARFYARVDPGLEARLREGPAGALLQRSVER